MATPITLDFNTTGLAAQITGELHQVDPLTQADTVAIPQGLPGVGVAAMGGSARYLFYPPPVPAGFKGGYWLFFSNEAGGGQQISQEADPAPLGPLTPATPVSWAEAVSADANGYLTLYVSVPGAGDGLTLMDGGGQVVYQGAGLGTPTTLYGPVNPNAPAGDPDNPGQVVAWTWQLPSDLPAMVYAGTSEATGSRALAVRVVRSRYASPVTFVSDPVVFLPAADMDVIRALAGVDESAYPDDTIRAIPLLPLALAEAYRRVPCDWEALSAENRQWLRLGLQYYTASLVAAQGDNDRADDFQIGSFRLKTDGDEVSLLADPAKLMADADLYLLRVRVPGSLTPEARAARVSLFGVAGRSRQRAARCAPLCGRRF